MLVFLLELVKVFDEIPVHRLQVISFDFQLVVLFHSEFKLLLLPIVGLLVRPEILDLALQLVDVPLHLAIQLLVLVLLLQ